MRTEEKVLSSFVCFSSGPVLLRSLLVTPHSLLILRQNLATKELDWPLRLTDPLLTARRLPIRPTNSEILPSARPSTRPGEEILVKRSKEL